MEKDVIQRVNEEEVSLPKIYEVGSFDLIRDGMTLRKRFSESAIK